MSHKEQAPIILTRKSIGLAFVIARNAHRLLNAILDDKPKAEIVTELAVHLYEFTLNSVELTDLGDDGGVIDEIDQRFAESHYYSVRVDEEADTLTLEAREGSE